MTQQARVLLIEDNPDDVFQVKRVLSHCGLLDHLKVVCDGNAAIDLLAEQLKEAPEAIPDLIILDLKLPKVSGMEVLQWIRADQRLSRIPVVVLTGTLDDASLVELHRLGVLGYLVKPLTSKDFARTVAGCVALAPA